MILPSIEDAHLKVLLVHLHVESENKENKTNQTPPPPKYELKDTGTRLVIAISWGRGVDKKDEKRQKVQIYSYKADVMGIKCTAW